MGSLFMTRFRMGLALAGTLGAPWAAAPASPRAQVVSEFQGAQGLPELLERRQELQRGMEKLNIKAAQETESEREHKKLILEVFDGKEPARVEEALETLAAHRGLEGVYWEGDDRVSLHDDTLEVFARMEDGARRHVDTLWLRGLANNRSGLVDIHRLLGEMAKASPGREGNFIIDGAPKEALARLRENGYQVDFQRQTLRLPDGSERDLAIGRSSFPHDITLQPRPDADPTVTHRRMPDGSERTLPIAISFHQDIILQARPDADPTVTLHRLSPSEDSRRFKLTREGLVRRPPDETAD